MGHDHEDPQHRDAWRAEYDLLVAEVSPLRAAVERARERKASNTRGYRKRMDVAITKRKAKHGGELPDGAMPLLNVGRSRLTEAEDALAGALEQRDAAYARIRAHKVTCELCRDGLAATLELCTACGLHREDVESGARWPRCAACRSLDVSVPL